LSDGTTNRTQEVALFPPHHLKPGHTNSRTSDCIRGPRHRIDPRKLRDFRPRFRASSANLPPSSHEKHVRYGCSSGFTGEALASECEPRQGDGKTAATGGSRRRLAPPRCGMQVRGGQTTSALGEDASRWPLSAIAMMGVRVAAENLPNELKARLSTSHPRHGGRETSIEVERASRGERMVGSDAPRRPALEPKIIRDSAEPRKGPVQSQRVVERSPFEKFTVVTPELAAQDTSSTAMWRVREKIRRAGSSNIRAPMRRRRLLLASPSATRRPLRQQRGARAAAAQGTCVWIELVVENLMR